MFFVVNIRSLLKQTNDLIEICYDFHIGMRSIPDGEEFDIEQVNDRLSELRDVLEKLFKTSTSGDQSVGSDLISGPLSTVKNQLSEMEVALKQDSGRKRTKGPSSIFDPRITLAKLGSNTTALREAMDVPQRYVPDWYRDAHYS